METSFSFTGEAIHTLDDKGRLALPGKIREELQKSERPEEVVAYADPRGEGFVALYPYEQWQKVEASVSTVEDTSLRKALSRDLGRNSIRLVLDKSGRINLSQKHREIAGLEREVVLLGSLYTVELWSKNKLDGQMVQDENLALVAKQNLKLPL